MNFQIYVIKSQSSGKIYIGQTADLAKRLQRHNSKEQNKKSSYTSKNKGPWTPVYQEECSDRITAMKREKELKSARGREFLKTYTLR